MGYLKGKSALMMFDKHANLKYKFGNRHFWAEGYYVSTVGLNEATIKKYIQRKQQNMPKIPNVYPMPNGTFRASVSLGFDPIMGKVHYQAIAQ